MLTYRYIYISVLCLFAFMCIVQINGYTPTRMYAHVAYTLRVNVHRHATKCRAFECVYGFMLIALTKARHINIYMVDMRVSVCYVHSSWLAK